MSPARPPEIARNEGGACRWPLMAVPQTGPSECPANASNGIIVLVMYGAEVITDECVRAASDGSAEALARVLEDLQPQTRLMVAARLSPTPCQLEDVEDIVQEIELALTSGITGLEDKSVDGLRAYLSGIVTKNVALFLRRAAQNGGVNRNARSLDATIGVLSNAGALWQFLSSSGTSPLSAAERADQAARLLLELGRLKEEHREVITLAFFDQLPPGEIGRRLGRSREAASMLLLRAIQTLRRNLGVLSQTRKLRGVQA